MVETSTLIANAALRREADLAARQPGEEADKKRPSVATRLVALAEDFDLFHTPNGTPFASIKRDGHVETWPLGSRAIRDYLARRYYGETGGAAHSQALQDALNVLRGRALFDGHEEPVYVRLAAHDGKLYLDLCDPAWRVVEVTDNGWEVTTCSPVRFARNRGMVALPIPGVGGDVRVLRNFLNVMDGEWPLILGWLVGAFMPTGPYPVLVINGEQGSAKSTAAKVLRSLIDPSTVPLRSLPRDERDLAIAAGNSWVIALDNVSRLPHWLSDAICRLATGGGFATRELYTDSEEVLFAAARPVVLNGIGDIAVRSDLLDRAITVTLPTIPNEKRRTEAEFWTEFERLRPTILAALLAAAALALRDVRAVRLDATPRMADFTRWVVAAAPAVGLAPKDFLDAYTGNRSSINAIALESSPVAAQVIALSSKLAEGGEWSGTATELLEKLNGLTGDAILREKGWPKNARSLSSALARLAPNLRAVGVGVEWGGEGSGNTKRRTICIRKAVQTSDPCVPSDPPAMEGAQKRDARLGTGTQNGTQDSQSALSNQQQGDAWDAGDAKNPTSSNTPDHRENVLGMPVSEALELWRSEGAPWIYLGPNDNCNDLAALLSNPDILDSHLEAVRAWLDKVQDDRQRAFGRQTQTS